MCVPPFAHTCVVAGRYSATNSQDLTSVPSTVKISVLKSNDMPSADQQTATLPASAKSVDLTIVTVDSDSQFVSLFINSLPVQGSLYYSSSTATSQIESFVNLSPPPIEQYGHKILEASTYWPSGPAKKWHPDMALGAPDSKWVYGDSVLASSWYCRDGCGETCSYSITTGGKTRPHCSHMRAPSHPPIPYRLRQRNSQQL